MSRAVGAEERAQGIMATYSIDSHGVVYMMARNEAAFKELDAKVEKNSREAQGEASLDESEV